MKKLHIYLKDDWIRAVYYSELHRVLHGLPWPKGPLEILEWAKGPGVIPEILGQISPFNLKLAPYPEYDIQGGLKGLKGLMMHSYDVVITDQVLEHVPDPFAAVRTCSLLCRQGGVLIFGTPWQYPYHPAPKDYWRISRDAYQMLFDRFGIETIEIDGWGHKEALIFGHQTDGFLTTNRTVEMAEQAGLFEVENDPDHAIEIWAVGRKR